MAAHRDFVQGIALSESRPCIDPSFRSQEEAYRYGDELWVCPDMHWHAKKARSKSVGVECGICHEDIGDQFKPGDGYDLFRAHMEVAHPGDAQALSAAQEGGAGG